MISRITALILCGFLIVPNLQAADRDDQLVDWQDWSAEVFEKARKENRYVVLDLEAIWCHWCHVMDQTTYRDEKVLEVLEKHYVAVKVDQDSRPDLASRYRDYGWPATIFFAPDGTEIVKRSGYINPDNMVALLEAIVEDPSPESAALDIPQEYAGKSSLDEDVRQDLIAMHGRSLDRAIGGLDSAHKYLERDSVEWAALQASRGDEGQRDWTIKTLDSVVNLLDPAWGGVYQYSTHGDWDHPHYEKIMSSQAGYMRAYALAYAQFGDERYLKVADEIVRYIDNFMTSPEGAFYTSQDADLVQGQKAHDFFLLDDADRRAAGIPRVDKNTYARENGWMIEALATLYEMTGKKAYLDRALKSAEWVIENRSIEGGGYKHGVNDPGGPFLGDNMAMGRAFLQLHRVTADRYWLEMARGAADFIDRNLRGVAGYTTAADDGSPVKPVPQVDENMPMARFANLLFHYTGDERYKEMAEHTIKYLGTPSVARARLTEAGILLADSELGEDPTHLTIIGYKDDPQARKLFETALRQSGWYKRVEWWDTREGPMPNPDVQYPQLDKAAAFICTNQRCSLPLFTSEEMLELLARVGA